MLKTFTIAVVLQSRLNPRRPDAAQLLIRRSLAKLGIPSAKVQQIDVHRLSRKGPDARPLLGRPGRQTGAGHRR